jgi:ribosome modulation factor
MKRMLCMAKEIEMDATDQGFDAGMHGETFESCPFSGVKRMEWEDGWHIGNEERIDREQWSSEDETE